MSEHIEGQYRKSLLPEAKFKGKKVCVLTNYRTGSTFFIRETFLENRLMPMENWEHFNTNKQFDFLVNELHERSAFVFKLMPDQINLDKEKYHTVLSECDEIVYLFRRDFKAQARGWIAWNLSGDHEHHYGEIKKYDINVTQEIADYYSKELIDNYKFMNYSFKRYPGSVYCLEDFPIQVPYSRIYNWQTNIKIPEFNTHKEVFRS
jgi:hypothetical protein